MTPWGHQAQAETIVSSNTSNDGTGDVIGLPNVVLGQGYDTDTQSIIPIPAAYNASNLVAALDGGDANSVIDVQPSMYEDYSRYTHTAESSVKAEKKNIKGGMGLSYGLYSASIKFGLEKAEELTNASFSVEKSAGFLFSQKSSLLVDADPGRKITPNNIKLTALALMQAIPGLRDAIEKIRNAKSSAMRNEALLEFYANFGTSTITSVTRGYVGYHQVTLTQSSQAGSASSGQSYDVGFSAPFVSGGATFNQASASQFNKSNWNFSSVTKMKPYSEAQKTMLDSIFKAMDAEIKSQNEMFDISKVVSTDKSEVRFPDISTMDYKPNPELIEKLDKQREVRAGMADDLGNLQVELDVLKELVVSRDAAADLEEKKELNTVISSTIINSSPINVLLEKFRKTPASGGYLGLALTSEQSALLSLANQEILALRRNINTSADKIKSLEKASTANQIANANAAKQKDKLDFTNYLKSEWSNEPVTDRPTFKVWFDKKTAEEISQYSSAWKADLEKNQLVSPDAFEQPPQQLKKRMVLRKNMLARRKKMERSDDEPGKMAVLDFNIVPWSIIFPELTSKVIETDVDLVKSKLVQKLNSYTMIRSYLLRISSLDSTPVLNEMYIQSNGVANELNELLAAIKNTYDSSTDASVIRYANTDYNVITDVKKLEDLIDKKINTSSMGKSEWYRIVHLLYQKGFLQPQGALFVVQRMENFFDWKPEVGKHIIYSPTDVPVPSSYRMSEYSSVNKNYGQQLARSVSRKNQKILSVLPLIFANSHLTSDQRAVTNVGYLDSGGGIYKFELARNMNSKAFYATGSYIFPVILDPKQINYSSDYPPVNIISQLWIDDDRPSISFQDFNYRCTPVTTYNDLITPLSNTDRLDFGHTYCMEYKPQGVSIPWLPYFDVSFRGATAGSFRFNSNAFGELSLAPITDEMLSSMQVEVSSAALTQGNPLFKIYYGATMGNVNMQILNAIMGIN
jgi:hypothetical protein